MKDNLTQIFRINKFLGSIGYPDSYRISKEIAQYLNENPKISEESILKKLSKRYPWEYIQGYITFCNLKFKVSKDTLIPRIETEQLVYDCTSLIKENYITNIIDVGTGSGCIIISIASILGDGPYSFYGIDISPKALEVAKVNERNLLKSKKIKWLENNLIEKIPIITPDTIVIANLPYIPTEKYKKLDKSVLEYEPKIALDGGKDGLMYYEHLFNQLLSKQTLPKILFMETENSIFDNTKKLITKYFGKVDISEILDCFERKRFLKILL
jgi:release factor glutamine methyltransferase